MMLTAGPGYKPPPMRKSISVLLLLGACRPAPPHAQRAATADTAPAASPVAAARAPQDTGFRGTMQATHRTRSGTSPRILRGVDARSTATYDRIAFEFADTAPGYHVEYATRPVVRCGSGDPVTVAGTARLVVRLEPARAHDERGNSSVERREWSPGLPAVKEVKLICDFEGQVEWVLGITAARPYRVVDTGSPARLVLDVRHGP